MTPTERTAELVAYRQAREDYDLAIRNFQRMAPRMMPARRDAVRGELLRRRAELVRLRARLSEQVQPMAGTRGRPRKYATPDEAADAKRVQNRESARRRTGVRNPTAERTAEERIARRRASDARSRAARGVRVGGPTGRPRKYATPEEAAEARRIQARDSKRRLTGVTKPRGDNINRRKK